MSSWDQNAPAFVIGSREREIDFAVPPADAATLPVGAAVSFQLEWEELSPEGDPVIRGTPERRRAPRGGASRRRFPLTFGAVGTVGYTVTLARGALVPTGSLQTNEDQNFVYVVESGKAIARRITILAESGNTAAVTGVSTGSLGVVNPPPGLLDGSVGESDCPSRKEPNENTRDIQARIFDRINPAVRFSVTRYVFAIGVFVAIFAFGLISVLNLGVDQFPSLNFPYVVVTTTYPGASPSVVDQQITQVIENAVSTISGITDINSVSSTGASQVIIAFDQSTDQNSDANKVASVVSAVTRRLPLGVSAPIVQTFNPAAIPVVQFGVSGSGASLGRREHVGHRTSSRRCWSACPAWPTSRWTADRRASSRSF